MLREWATATFQSATDYWTFRKVITLQVANTQQKETNIKKPRNC